MMITWNSTMMTFLPFPDFTRSAQCLDSKRLGKQRVECLQILHANLAITEGWRNHPATLMWRGYLQALADYALCICEEWGKRCYRDTVTAQMEDYLAGCSDWSPECAPPWLGDERLHSSHRAALLAKAPAHYGKFGWKEVPKIEYWWPSKEQANDKCQRYSLSTAAR